MYTTNASSAVAAVASTASTAAAHRTGTAAAISASSRGPVW